MMEEVQKFDNANCDIPSSEFFRKHLHVKSAWKNNSKENTGDIEETRDEEE
jgi:hypothetical protein